MANVSNRKTLVFGSLNIDRTYSVHHFVKPGETISAKKMELFCGGKGFNQAVALARAGNEVFFAGAVGEDGGILTDALRKDGIKLDYVQTLPGASGHAVIQVDETGQNCIIILAGSNGAISRERIDQVLADFGSGDLIVLQNEISNVDYIIQQAHARGMVVAFNPSPYDGYVERCDLNCVDYLLINEVEGEAIAGVQTPEDILQYIHARYPELNIVLTLGSEGSVYMSKDGGTARYGIYALPPVDTTSAGDTFAGYFLSEIRKGAQPEKALRTAAIASGIAVSRLGASPSIPKMDEVAAVEI